VTYVYDGDGNRVARTVAGSTVRYLMDEQNPTGYVQVAEEVAAGLVIAQYVHGPQRISVRQSVSGTWGKSYYGYDAFGTTRALLDAAGALTDTWTFDGFGNVVDRTGSTPNQYLYRGEALDAGTGMYYLRARWYRPEVGRFLTRDALNLESSDFPAALHSYMYSNADPVGQLDPSGYLAKVEYSILASITVGTGIQAVVAGTAYSIACIYTRVKAQLDDAAGVPPLEREKPVIPQCVSPCARDLPHLVPLSRATLYIYPSEHAAFDEIKRAHRATPLKIEKRKPADRGPCSIDSGYKVGDHINVLTVKGREHAGSIGHCECCDDSTGHAISTPRWAVLNIGYLQ
jgi:RHS repeat-associated protein